MKCPLCKNDLGLKIDRQYFQCINCMGMVRDERLALDASAERERYLTHNNDVNDPRYQKFTSPISDYILQHFQTGDKGLDFGSGTGPVISEVLRKYKYNVQQYDPFFANNPALLEQEYNYIFACEVVEHFHDPKKEFQRLKTMLKPGGALILMTLLYSENISFDDWHYRKDPTHVFIYTEFTFNYIRNLFSFKDLKIQDRLVILNN